MKTYVTREEITELGRNHADEAIRDSQSDCTDTPDGGWDSWLIAGWGIDKTIRAFGESPEGNQDGWSESMKEKLRWYHEGAVEMAERIESEA